MITVVVPTYNEEENVVPLSTAIDQIFQKELPEYTYEIVFIDNASQDRTRELLRELCQKNKHIRAIFNTRNFGPLNSPYYGLCQAQGDCAILIGADFQEPVELIPTFVREWEQGYKVVAGIKTSSRENKLMYAIRSLYYKLVKKFSSVEQIEHFTGFGLYDRVFIEAAKELDDRSPFLRGIVAELGFKRKDIPYEQQLRRAGKSSYNFFSLYDISMLSFTSYTKVGLRIATFLGMIFSFLSLLVALVYLVLKLMYWDRFPAGTAPILLGVFIFGSIQLFFIGLLGEYIMNISTRMLKRPLVIEEERLNFPDGEDNVEKGTQEE